MRYYSSVAPTVDLTGSMTNVATTMTVSSTTGFPGTTPYTLVVDPGLGTEEIVEVTNVAGLTLTVTRGVDGSSAQAHSAGVQNVRHMATGRDFAEPQAHIAASQNVHGIGATSNVVGTSTSQVLDNKTFTSSTGSTTPLIVKQAASQTASLFALKTSTNADMLTFVNGELKLTTVTYGDTLLLRNGDAAFFWKATVESLAAAADVVPVIVKGAASQTADLLQAKNSAGTVLAKIDKDGKLTAAGSTIAGAPVVTTTATQTLTNKTLTAPATTGLTGDTATLTGAVSAASVSTSGGVTATGAVAGSNIPSTIAATSATKDKKKMHWGSYAITTDATGTSTVTHAAGFTPTVVVTNRSGVSGSLWRVDQVGNFTATTFDVRVLDGSGSVAPNGTSLTILAFLGE